LQGRAEGAVVLITGLPVGMTLSAGTAVGAEAWQVPATDTVLSNTWIIPPKDFAGAVDLVAELHLSDATIASRRPLPLEWVAALPPAIASPAVAAPSPAAPTVVPATPTPMVGPAAPRQAAPTPRQLDREEVAVLVRRGKDFLVSGDVAAARLLL